MKDEAVEVVGQIGKREFGLRSGQADGANEQAIAVLRMLEDMLDVNHIVTIMIVAVAHLGGKRSGG